MERKNQIQQEIECSKDNLPLRRMDASLIRWLGVLSENDICEDLYPEEDWKVNLYTVGDKFGKLKIDLNRDGLWDEEWILQDKGVVRTILQNNKKSFKEFFIFKEECWVRIKSS